MKKDDILKLLEQRAKGFSYQETTEEYAIDGGEEKKTKETDAVLKSGENCVVQCESKKRGRPKKDRPASLQLIKKKVTTFFVPPDMTAIKMLIELSGTEKNIPIEQLAKRREELLKEIKKLLKDEK